MRVLHTIDTTGPGGAESVFLDLIRSLDKNTFQAFVVIRGKGWVSQQLEHEGITPIFLNSKGRFNFNYLWQLVLLIKKHKIDVIQSHLLGSNLYCCLAGLFTRVPVISTFHGFVDIKRNDKFARLKSLIINLGSSKVVFVSQCLKDYFVTNYGLNNSKATVIYNSVDTSIYRKNPDVSVRLDLHLPTNSMLVGALGNIRPAKGYDSLLKAARIVVDNYPNTYFAVAGEGKGEIFEKLVDLKQELGLNNNFFFIGHHSNPAKFLNNLDIFVLSSLSEGFSISTIEAMASSLPIVATKCGGPEEIISDDIDGVLAGAGNPRDIADAIMMLLASAELRGQIAKNASLTANAKFSNQAMIGNYSTLYTSFEDRFRRWRWS
ncbi:glycosyltransferase [Geomonas paludis]|uniref:Glycosyltransferase n=2 Tax=Geomonas paludis TaxID=2740185 RepID=A0ABY4LLX2_9BACT|nr:glycosyltransferase [Geomonas paludis]UPU37768.1 glycosyltransferase [Geomonas paludis]